jgi:hypothetical protein
LCYDAPMQAWRGTATALLVALTGREGTPTYPFVELFLTMCEGSMLFPAIRGAALPWMKRTVREIARKWVRMREEEAGPGAAE